MGSWGEEDCGGLHRSTRQLREFALVGELRRRAVGCEARDTVSQRAWMALAVHGWPWLVCASSSLAHRFD